MQSIMTYIPPHVTASVQGILKIKIRAPQFGLPYTKSALGERIKGNFFLFFTLQRYVCS
jgi:hypothetical protein